MERFVGLVVAGGTGLVAGLWLLKLAPTGSPAPYAGAALAVVGGVTLLAGIERRLTWPRE